MSFDWMNTSARPGAGSARQHWIDEITERAGLLCRLKYSQKAAVKRIEANLAWEFDAEIGLTPLPSFYKDVPALVARVYQKS